MDYLAFIEEAGLNLAVFRGGRLLFSSREEGLRPLLRAVEELGPLCPRGCVIADRIVGRAAALIALLLEPSEVHAIVMSSAARGILTSRGVRTVARELVEFITRPDGRPCPFEEALRGVDKPEEAYELVRRMLSGISRRNRRAHRAPRTGC